MKTILVTGADGFIGKNLSVTLRTNEFNVLSFTKHNSLSDLDSLLEKADFVYHIAGVNRPTDETEFTTGNTDLTKYIADTLVKLKKKTPILISSSVQAELDNPYGISKRNAEEHLIKLSNENGNPLYIYRLPGVFGKWSKPNYNSVVATFCYNISHNLPVEVSDPKRIVTLTYIDDVVKKFISHLENTEQSTSPYYEVGSVFEVSLGDLKDRIEKIESIRSTLIVPNLSDLLNKYLYATYISYFDTDNFSYELEKKSDNRGWLAEFVKSKEFGQIFISKTKPGISRGNHWHHTKIEKFLVVEGKGEIFFRNKIQDQSIIRYKVDGETPTVLDIPTGYVHAIKNTGESDLITIFWANEILNPEAPDTYYEEVETGGSNE